MTEKVIVQYVQRDSYILDFPHLTIVFQPEYLRKKIVRQHPILFLSTKNHGNYDYRRLLYPDHSKLILPSLQKLGPKQRVVAFSSRPQQRLIQLKPYDHLSVYGVDLVAYPSFHGELAYFIQLGDLTCFYGGSLDFYPKKGLSARGKQKRMASFHSFLRNMEEEELDLVFFSIKSFIQHKLTFAQRALMDKKEAKIFFPLGFHPSFGASQDFAKEFKGSKTAILPLHKPGDLFEIYLTFE